MKSIAIAFVFFLAACGQNSNKKEVPVDTSGTVKTLPAPEVKITLTDTVSAILKTEQPGWVLVNDSTAGWPKDEFDYFVGPRRKEEPYYPYLISSDFDADKKTDAAALVTQPGTKNFAVAIIRDMNGNKQIDFWKEDIDVAALSVYPKGEINGVEGGHVKMNADGVGVEYYEKSSFVIYWDGKKWKRTWTSD